MAVVRIGRRRLAAPWSKADGVNVGAIVVALLTAALVLYPLVMVVLGIFFTNGHFSLVSIQQAFHQPGLGGTLADTAVVVGIGGGLAVLVAILFAWLNEYTDAHLGRFGNVLPLIPLVIPPIAGAIGWTFLLSPTSGYLNVALRALLHVFGVSIDSGPLNVYSWPGLILTYAGYLLPYAYLPIAAALRNIDPALEEAAATSGASRWRTLRTVTLPAVGPAIASAVVLVLIAGLSLYSIPVIIGVGQNKILLSVTIVRLLTASFPPQTGAAVVLGALILVVVAGFSALQVRLNRSMRRAQISGRSRIRTRVRLGPLRWIGVAAMIVYLLLESVFPFLSILLVSLQKFWSSTVKVGALGWFNYTKVFGQDPIVSSSLLRSLELAVLGATAGVIMAVLLTLFARRHKTAGSPISTLTSLPGSVSHIVMAVGFILAFSGSPFHLGDTFTILLICYVTLYLPQTYLASTTAIGQVGEDLLEASRTSGAPDRVGLRRVLLPLATRGLANGWALAFVLILGDLTASVLLAGTNNSVVGFEVLDLYQNGTYPELAALATVISLIGLLILLVVLRFTGGFRGNTGLRTRLSI